MKSQPITSTVLLLN